MSPELIAALVAGFLGAGGVTGAIVAWRRAGPESRSIEVATIRQVMEELRDEMYEERAANNTCKEMLERTRWELAQNRSEMTRLEVQVSAFRHRIDRLEEFIRLNTEWDPEDINGHPI